eukprot:CAMPEP_0195126996 /NCGR_PEP_ID=MMETSP0448-20130528/136079_1 /TAXON_ID=66468 /ORGANISM="Heterocapsa triquestra, Strain CCMP 448" /LENGTH=56 /DNA_ID=CAMNT_0040164705 /DNA_START=1 /DNA_END=168 /DNA_ORIENTATION=+
MYELRCHLTSVHERVQKRDQAIKQMMERQEQQEAAKAALGEQLRFAEEGLRSAIEE